MLERKDINPSMNKNSTKQTSRDNKCNRIKHTNRKRTSIGIGFGAFLTLVTFILQCIAFCTPHWKEISPKTHSLYIENIDALIRIEILHYFNSVHRNTRHSYGLFQRCEYPLSNSSIYHNQSDFLDHDINKKRNKCTKNFLPRYDDDQFNRCHSLPYYQFCATANEQQFNINDDYLVGKFDVSSSSKTLDAKVPCNCYYPSYAIVCHIVGIIALISLVINILLFCLFPCIKKPHYRVKIKCFGILSSILTIIFLTLNLIIIEKHLEYEPIAYLIAIKRHYTSSQVYKLSKDTNTAIDRLLSNINIRSGYSAILARIALGLSIFDGILLLATFKITDDYHEKETHANLLSSENHQHHTPLQFTGNLNDSQSLPAPMPIMNNLDGSTPNLPYSHYERYQTRHILNDDEV